MINTKFIKTQLKAKSLKLFLLKELSKAFRILYKKKELFYFFIKETKKNLGQEIKQEARQNIDKTVRWENKSNRFSFLSCIFLLTSSRGNNNHINASFSGYYFPLNNIITFFRFKINNIDFEDRCLYIKKAPIM